MRIPLRLLLFVSLVSCSRGRDGSQPRADASIAREPSAPQASASASTRVQPATSASSASRDGDAAPRSVVCAREPDAKEVASTDGKLVVFVSTDRSRTDATSTDDVPHQDLCIARDGAPPLLLLAGRSAPDDAGVEATLAAFDNLLLSPDRKTLYFTSAAWVTSGAAHAVDLTTGKERFLFDGAVEAIIDAGPYKGMLLATHYRLDDKYPVESPKYRGRMMMWSIVSPDGKTIRRLPEEEPSRSRAIAGR